MGLLFYTLKIQFRSSKFSLFFIASLLVVFFGCTSILDDSVNSYIYALLMFFSLSLVDTADIRYQQSIDYTQLTVIPLSFQNKYILLILNEILGLKFIVLSPYIIVLALSGNVSPLFMVYYLLIYFCYCNIILFFKHLVRRYAVFSVIIKNIIGIPFLFLAFVLKPTYYPYFYANINDIKVVVLVFFIASILTNYFMLILLRKRPMYKIDIINNYNKKYWY